MGLCQLLPLAMLMAHSFHAHGATQAQNREDLLAHSVDPITADLVLQIEYSKTPQDIDLTVKTLEIGCKAPPGILIYGSDRGHQHSYERRGR